MVFPFGMQAFIMLHFRSPKTSRDSSGVEHAHGKGGVVGSIPILGSIVSLLNFLLLEPLFSPRMPSLSF